MLVWLLQQSWPPVACITGAFVFAFFFFFYMKSSSCFASAVDVMMTFRKVLFILIIQTAKKSNPKCKPVR